MSVLRTAFKEALEADATLNALLPGGIFDAEEMDFTGQGSTQIPRDPVDGITVLAHAIIRWRDDISYMPYRLGAAQATVEVYVYQDTGYLVIEAAINRIRLTWHDRYLTADDQKIAHFSFVSKSGEVPAQSSAYPPARFIRFSIIHIDR